MHVISVRRTYNISVRRLCGSEQEKLQNSYSQDVGKGTGEKDRHNTVTKPASYLRRCKKMISFECVVCTNGDEPILSGTREVSKEVRRGGAGIIGRGAGEVDRHNTTTTPAHCVVVYLRRCKERILFECVLCRW